MTISVPRTSPALLYDITPWRGWLQRMPLLATPPPPLPLRRTRPMKTFRSQSTPLRYPLSQISDERKIVRLSGTQRYYPKHSKFGNMPQFQKYRSVQSHIVLPDINDKMYNKEIWILDQYAQAVWVQFQRWHFWMFAARLATGTIIIL